MASVRVIVRGIPELNAALGKIKSPGNRRVLERALKKSAYLVQRIATTEKIIRGGPKGAPPDPSRVTSRTGRLRGSIAVDLTGAPAYAEIGSAVVYAPIHEFGGTVSRRKGSATYPPRPYLGPALDDAAKSFSDIFADEFKAELGL